MRKRGTWERAVVGVFDGATHLLFMLCFPISHRRLGEGRAVWEHGLPPEHREGCTGAETEKAKKIDDIKQILG